MTIALINLFLIGCAMMFAVLTYFAILWLMWKGVRDSMKRWKEMTEEEQNNFVRLAGFKVVATVLLLELSGMGVFALSSYVKRSYSPSLGRIAPRGRAENGDTHSCVAALIARCECGVQNTKKPLFYQNSLLHWWVYAR